MINLPKQVLLIVQNRSAQNPERKASRRLSPDSKANLPVHGTQGCHHPAMVAGRRQSEHVGVCICRLQGEMVVPVPAAAGQPDSKGVVLGGRPGELQPVAGRRIVDGGKSIRERGGKNLGARIGGSGSHDVVQISRVTGYLQDVSGWNAGKQQELKDRVRYSVA